MGLGFLKYSQKLLGSLGIAVVLGCLQYQYRCRGERPFAPTSRVLEPHKLGLSP